MNKRIQVSHKTGLWFDLLICVVAIVVAILLLARGGIS